MFNGAHNALGNSCRAEERREVISFSWQDFDNLTAILADRIRAEGLPDIIVGLERGGLIPAVALSHQLGVRPLLSLSVQRTTSDAIYAEKGAPYIRTERSDLSSINGRDMLVVDDIAGTGQSLQAVLHTLTSYRPIRLRSAVYIVNRNNWDTHQTREPANVISHVGKEVRGWVVFPWEKKEHYG